jgi:hypothetical protein
MAKLKTSVRNKLPKSDFGLPGERKYPMPDRSHAINAKARATQMVKKGKLSASSAHKIKEKADGLLAKMHHVEKKHLKEHHKARHHLEKKHHEEMKHLEMKHLEKKHHEMKKVHHAKHEGHKKHEKHERHEKHEKKSHEKHKKSHY